MGYVRLDANYRSFFSEWKKRYYGATAEVQQKIHFFTKKCKSGFSFSDTAVALSHKLNGLPLTFGTPKVVRLECVDYVAVSENNGQF